MSSDRQINEIESEASVQETRFFALSPDLLCVSGFDGYFKQLNPAWEKTLGFTNSELLSYPYLQLVHPQDKEATTVEIRKLTASTQTSYFENRVRCQDGSYKWLSWKAVTFVEEQLWYAIARDVTGAKTAAEALKQAEANYRSIYENAVEGIFQTTVDGHYISANSALARIYGYTRAGELIAALTDIEHQLYVDPNRRVEFSRLLQEHETVCDFESEIYRRDGSIIWISENARTVRDESGKLLYYEGFVEDITARKQAEAELEKSLSLLLATLESTADGIVAVDLQGKIVSFNQKFVQMWGVPEAIATSLEYSQLLTFQMERVADPQAFIVKVKNLGDRPDAEAYDIFTLKDGRVFERYSLPQRIGEKIVGRVFSFCDITERQKVERMKNEFVSMVSHELRTPLTSIRGSLSLIAGGVTGEIPPQAKELVNIAFKNSERLVLLINDILDIEKIESGKMDFQMEPVELVPLVERAIAANRAYGEQFGVQFQLKLEDNLKGININVDSHRLMQVISNLLSNAAKFSPANETVTIAATRQQKTVRVAVSDRGAGIPEAFRPKIFQKFAQADSTTTREKGGTGLGLSISKAIIEKLGGTIGFETETNAGTTFYFYLPQWDFPERRSPYRPRILICEHDRDTAQLLGLMLEEGGFHTEIAYNAARAKQLLARNSPDNADLPYAAMTVDLAMPDQDGISLIRELREREHWRDLPIVIVSAQSLQGCQEFIGSGFAVIDWLDKPIDRGRLIAAVEKAALHRKDSKPRILHIEDDPDVLQVVSVILQDVAEVTHAANLQETQQQLATKTFDLVILDLELPDGSGLELLPKLKCQSKKTVPVVVFSARDLGKDAARKVEATLVKSRTSNQELLDTIKSLIANN